MLKIERVIHPPAAAALLQQAAFPERAQVMRDECGTQGERLADIADAVFAMAEKRDDTRPRRFGKRLESTHHFGIECWWPRIENKSGLHVCHSNRRYYNTRLAISRSPRFRRCARRPATWPVPRPSLARARRDRPSETRSGG